VFKIARDIKDLYRFKKIVSTFFEEGFGFYIKALKLQGHVPVVKRYWPAEEMSDKTLQAISLRRAFEKLGPTFVKFGQILSLRPDILPAEYLKELSKLQDHVPVFSYDEVKKTVEEDLGKPVDKIFKEFSEKPVASASISQVHKAKLKSGKEVAVKVLRPNIKKIIDSDLDIMFFIAHSLEKKFPTIKPYQPVNLVKEFAYWTRKEINLENEARNATRMKINSKDVPQVFIPRVYEKYSTKRLLVLEWVDGIKLDNIKDIKKAKIDPKKVAYDYFAALMVQCLIQGFFHADPHPANIFVNKKGKLVFLDFGIMGELTKSDRDKIMKVIRAMYDNNSETGYKALVSLAKDTSDADITSFKKEAIQIMEQGRQDLHKQKSVAKGYYDLVMLGARKGVIFDPNHVLTAKALLQSEGLVAKLYPTFNPDDATGIFYDQYLKRKYSPEAILSTARIKLLEQRELLEELPEHIIKIIENLEKEKDHEYHVDEKQLHELESEFESVNRRRNIGLIISALVIAAAILFYVEGRSHIFGMSIGLILLTLALSLLFYLFLFYDKKKHF
jgi:ubiquinone biosynthesis protein